MKIEEVLSWDNFVKALETIKDMAPEEVEVAAEVAIKQLNNILSEFFTPETLEEAKSILEQFFSPELIEEALVKPREVIELLPGRTYVIEVPDYLSNTQRDRLYEMLHRRTAHVNCEFLILDGGMKIAKG